MQVGTSTRAEAAKKKWRKTFLEVGGWVQLNHRNPKRGADLVQEGLTVAHDSDVLEDVVEDVS